MNEASVIALTDLPLPALLPAQFELFTSTSIHAQANMPFNVSQADQLLKNKDGTRVLGADFGGDKGIVRSFMVTNGQLAVTDEYHDDIQGNDGDGYLDTIRRAAEYAQAQNMSLGIAWGGPLTAGKLEFHPKAKTFIAETNEQYGGDLRQVAPDTVRVVLNDGPAGVISGAVEAYRRFGAKTVLFIINGGGIGLGVLKDGQIWATEAGHVEGVADLNTYAQTEACGVFGAHYVCLERLGANKAGIEAQWQAITGSYMRARDIEDRYKEGNELARDLYDHSAVVISHVLQGTAQALGIELGDTSTAVVAHGGAFKFPQYGQRIAQLLTAAGDKPVQLLMTKDYVIGDSNACLDGAAIAALVA